MKNLLKSLWCGIFHWNSLYVYNSVGATFYLRCKKCGREATMRLSPGSLKRLKEPTK